MFPPEPLVIPLDVGGAALDVGLVCPELGQLWLGVLDPVLRLDPEFVAELVDRRLESVDVIPALDEGGAEEAPADELVMPEKEIESAAVKSLEDSERDSLAGELSPAEVLSEVTSEPEELPWPEYEWPVAPVDGLEGTEESEEPSEESSDEL